MAIETYKSGPLAALLIFLFPLTLSSQTGSSKLPILLIDTYGRSIRDEPKIVSSLKIIDNGPGSINRVTDSPNGFDGNIGIEIRGQSSQMFPKKSYGFETIDAVGNDTDVSLLGMPEESDWILYAPYSDKSLLRNALTFWLGRRLEGEWQPRYRFCDLYINDTYAGIYILTERIKRGSSRIDINKLKPDENAGNSLSGGYIIKVDKIGGLSADEYFLTYPSDPPESPGNNEFTYVYPEWDEITGEQKTYIQNYIQTIEWSLRNASSSDPDNGFRKFLDEDSFVDFQLMQELTNNVDGYKYSTYFYKKRDSDGGKLYAGPLWDFDLCYGNVDYSPARLSTSGWLYTNTGNQGDHRIHWWKTMMNDRNYRKHLVARWKELRSGPFSTDSVISFIDNTVESLGGSVQLNFDRWPILGKYIWPNAFIGSTHEEEVNYLKGWVTERLNWIDSNIELAGVTTGDPYYAVYGVYPNPSKGDFNIEFYTSSTEEIHVRLFDLLGRKLLEYNEKPAVEGNQHIVLSAPGALSGYYILYVTQGERLVGRTKVLVID